MSEIEHKRMMVVAEIKADAEGVVEGYGAVFNNIDSYDDVVAPGAFARTLAEAQEQRRLPAMLWQHDPEEPIGVWTEMREDARGLLVRGRLANTQRGREALELIKMGALTGLSIGYNTVRSEMNDATGIRTLRDLDLWEVSPVTFPANSAARITGAKNISTERDFEKFLRAHGFSRSDAEQITSKGFKGSRGEPVPDSDVKQGEPANDELLSDLRSALERLA
jgi:HK97 family phage prohead protease